MRKKIRVVVLVVMVFISFLLFLALTAKRTDVFLQQYQISEDGTKLNIKVGVSSSSGYVRDMKVKEEENRLYVTFYSTVGINQRFGAQSEFEIELKPTCQEVYFNRDEKAELILQKNQTEQWDKP